MRRITLYLSDELYDAVICHAEAAGQKLSTFVGRKLAHLVDAPVSEGAEFAARDRREQARVARAYKLAMRGLIT